MTSEEVFRLLKTRLLPFNLIRLGVKTVAVGDPAIVTSENQNFTVTKGKASNGVSGRPKAVFID